MPEKPKAVGAVVLLRKDGAALLQHRDDKPGLRHAGMWVPPGGHRKPGESMEACAKREFLEETGYVCDKLNFLKSFIDNNVPGFPSYELTIYWARYDEVQTIKCSEGQDLKFLKRNDAANYSIPNYLIEIWDLAIKASNSKNGYER